MELKTLRQRCEARLHGLPLSAPFDLDRFCAAIAGRRGRPILLLPVERSEGPSGVWIGLADADVICYERRTSALHQEHIILHELSHVLCGHAPRATPDASIETLLLANLPLETIRGVWRRDGYTTDEEREAELLASLIRERTGGLASGHGATAVDAALNERLELSLAAQEG